jgi:hypothetical protein
MAQLFIWLNYMSRLEPKERTWKFFLLPLNIRQLGRQLCDVGSDASRLIAGEQPSRRVRIDKVFAIVIAHRETVRCDFGSPRRRAGRPRPLRHL